jgi:AAA ATPase domain
VGRGALIERGADRAWLESALVTAVAGRGSLVLVSGEAGIGKTRFAEDVVGMPGVPFLRGAAAPGGPAYGPVVVALRAHLRSSPEAASRFGPLRPHLALLLPELGDAVDESDRPTLFEAIRCAFVAVTEDGPAALLLDDLQWSDDATLELLAALAPSLRDLPLLVVGAYRSDEIPRAHPVRRLRDELRRNGTLHERVLEPLTAAGSTELATRVLGAYPSPRLAQMLHDRTNGIPFFVEELAAALDASGRLEPSDDGLVLALDADVPLPQTIKDAVLLHTSGLSPTSRARRPRPLRSPARASSSSCWRRLAPTAGSTSSSLAACSSRRRRARPCSAIRSSATRCTRTCRGSADVRSTAGWRR